MEEERAEVQVVVFMIESNVGLFSRDVDNMEQIFLVRLPMHREGTELPGNRMEPHPLDELHLKSSQHTPVPCTLESRR